METPSDGTQNSHPLHEVPPDLLQRLHNANARFHDEKQRMEAILQSNELDLERRLEPARKGLAEAEAELEEVTRKINEALAKSGS